MSFLDPFEWATFVVEFVAVTVWNNGGTWQVQTTAGGGTSHNLTGPTDLASAVSAGETWLTGQGYTKITKWTPESATETRSVWVL